MGRSRNSYRRAGAWVSGTGWTTPPPPLEEAGDDHPPVPPPVAGELRHGFTLKDLHGIARLSVHVAGYAAGDWWDRYELAWPAIVECLYASTSPPRRADLVRAGQLAIYDEVTSYRQRLGFFKHKTIGTAAGAFSSPAFHTYWLDWIKDRTADHAPGVVERACLPQILSTLTERQRTALFTLAAHDDYQAAAEAMGVSLGTFNSYISLARKRFFALWHEGETPAPRWIDRRVASYSTPSDRRSTLARRLAGKRARRARGSNTTD